MKKILMLFLVFSNYYSGDFYDKICNVIRQGINTLPEIGEDSLELLKNKYVIGLGLAAVALNSYKKKKSIPFLRIIENIKHAKKEERSEKIFLKIKEMNKNNDECLLAKILEVEGKMMRFDPARGGDAIEGELKNEIEAFSKNEVLNLMYGKSEGELIAYKKKKCVLREIFKKIDNEEDLSLFNWDNIKSNFKYYTQYVINIFELILLLSGIKYVQNIIYE
jgi:hypothetical protein